MLTLGHVLDHREPWIPGEGWGGDLQGLGVCGNCIKGCIPT